jgi:hypothetical protein
LVAFGAGLADFVIDFVLFADLVDFEDDALAAVF